ncbi:MAG: SPOR domain-containing protein [Pseudomonadaceae bacterium]|nr:SPOR domain-containing protein [Pseudomonadaceae bacterium]
MTIQMNHALPGTRKVARTYASRCAAAIVLIACASGAIANDYVVQIGAFTKDVREYLEPARSYGQIVQRATASGATSYSVGPFGSEADARTALDLLQEHYPDAFVRRHSRDSLVAQSPAAATPAVIARTGNLSNEQTLANLTAEERERVVYLDGILHVKEGNEFIPLSQYQHRR